MDVTMSLAAHDCVPSVERDMFSTSNISSPLSAAVSCPSQCSSPLSSPPNSPSPPPEMSPLPPPALHQSYPSPPSSQQTSHSGSPTPESRNTRKAGQLDEGRATKRRRLSKDARQSFEGTAEYVDMRTGILKPEHVETMDRVLGALHKRQKIVVVAGAGMSVSAGIPDFRSSTGLFKSLRDEHKLRGSGMHLFDASVYKDDSSTSSFHSMVSSMSRLTKDAKPTLFHHMLATLADEGRLLRLYSQNVDGIDTALEPLKTNIPLCKGGNGKWPQTIQLHGGLDKMVCSKCHELSDFDANLFSGPVPPACSRCQEVNDIRTVHEGKRSHGIGRLRPRMVLYNEHNPDDEAIGSVTRDDLRKRPDAVIVVGTTLKVPGVRRIVREMCGVVQDRRDGVTIWINNDLPPVSKDLEDCFDIIVQGGCDEVASRAAMRKWHEPRESESGVEVTDAEARHVERVKGTVQVEVPASASSADLTHAYIVELPSKRHINNSFSPPAECATPKKMTERSPEFSPLTVRKHGLPTSSAAKGESVSVSGLLTPSKSRQRKPLNLLTQLQNAASNTVVAKGTKKTAAVKPKRTTKLQSKPQAKPRGRPEADKPASRGTITNTFQLSKGTNQKAKCEAKSPEDFQGMFSAFDKDVVQQSENLVPQVV